MIVIVALAVALGIPAYYVLIKKRAAASLDDLLAERFPTSRACPLAQLDVPSGGTITCSIAYEDKQQPGTLLVLGSWARGTVKVPGGVADVDNKVAGLFKPGTDWLARAKDAIATAPAANGAVAFWSGLPSRESVLAHLEATK